MPWLKSTRMCSGDVRINFEKKFETAEDCMASFTRFEKDSSFGMPSCWPIFWPGSDKELKIFEEFINAARVHKTDPTEELAKNLLGLVKSVIKHLNADESEKQTTAEEAKEQQHGRITEQQKRIERHPVF